MASNERRDLFMNFLSSLPAPVANELIRKLTRSRRGLYTGKRQSLGKKHHITHKRA